RINSVSFCCCYSFLILTAQSWRKEQVALRRLVQTEIPSSNNVTRNVVSDMHGDVLRLLEHLAWAWAVEMVVQTPQRPLKNQWSERRRQECQCPDRRLISTKRVRLRRASLRPESNRRQFKSS